MDSDKTKSNYLIQGYIDPEKSVCEECQWIGSLTFFSMDPLKQTCNYCMRKRNEHSEN